MSHRATTTCIESFAGIDPMQAALVLDRVSLNREDAVCSVVASAAIAQGWRAETEWTAWPSQQRIDIFAFAPQPTDGAVIFEAKKTYNAREFPAHVNQTASYLRQWGQHSVAYTDTALTQLRANRHPLPPRYRTRYLGAAAGRLAATEAFLVCPGFYGTKKPNAALEAATQGVLALCVEDAVRYLRDEPFRHVPERQYSTYQAVKAARIAPFVAALLQTQAGLSTRRK